MALGFMGLLSLDKGKGRVWLENLAAPHSQQPQALAALGKSLYDTESIHNASAAIITLPQG